MPSSPRRSTASNCVRGRTVVEGLGPPGARRRLQQRHKAAPHDAAPSQGASNQRHRVRRQPRVCMHKQVGCRRRRRVLVTPRWRLHGVTSLCQLLGSHLCASVHLDRLRASDSSTVSRSTCKAARAGWLCCTQAECATQEGRLRGRTRPLFPSPVTTVAPNSRAMSAVRSVDGPTETTTAAGGGSSAATQRSVAGRATSSLRAGMTTHTGMRDVS